MRSFSIWHWIVVALPIVLAVGAIALFVRALNKRRPEARGAAEISGPSGFGGWLTLLALGVFVSPVITIVLMTHLEDGTDNSLIQRFRLMFNGEIGIFAVVLLLQITTAVFMARRARLFILLYIVTGIAVILLKPIDIIWACAILYAQLGRSFQSTLQTVVGPEDVGRWISTTIIVGIWMLYVIRSRRVANTFVR